MTVKTTAHKKLALKNSATSPHVYSRKPVKHSLLRATMDRPVLDYPQFLSASKALEMVNWAISEGTEMGMGAFIAQSAIRVIGEDVFKKPSSSYFTVRFIAAGGGYLEMGGIRWGKTGSLTTCETLSLENDGLALGGPTVMPAISVGERALVRDVISMPKELSIEQCDRLMSWALLHMAAQGFNSLVQWSAVSIHQTSVAREGEFARWAITFRQPCGLIVSVTRLQLTVEGNVRQWKDVWDSRVFCADVRYDDSSLDNSWMLRRSIS